LLGAAFLMTLSGATASAGPILDEVMEAAESDGDSPRRGFTDWNEYDGELFSVRVGGGFLYDTAGYAQDDDSEEQLDLVPTTDVRDIRVLFKGQLKFVEGLSYTFGYMYDKSKEDWFVRQTGLMYNVPALNGSIFVGRTKEGFSTSKLMVGYQGWTNERAAINDAFLPILADGVKWNGWSSDGTFVYNIGWFGDQLSEDESFNKNDTVVAARGVWLPLAGTDQLLHLALEARFGDADDGFLQYRSRPEAYQAQTFAIDTGRFSAQHSMTWGAEAYYQPGPLMFGMEYYVNQVSSRERGDPLLHGGEIFASYLFTGETKPYNAKGGYFERTSPAQSVFDGGIGAWEGVLRFSYADLDDAGVEGGTFWRITPMVNWHMSDNVRLEFVTGYGMLDRFDRDGGTVFFQTRIQFQL
jgi:phosphate-selective porin OprO/OprP